MTRILVIDNYDSFVYNIVSYLAQIGAEVEVWRNDDERFERVRVRKALRQPEPLGFTAEKLALSARRLADGPGEGAAAGGRAPPGA